MKNRRKFKDRYPENWKDNNPIRPIQQPDPRHCTGRFYLDWSVR